MNKLTTRNWQRVRQNSSKKVLTFTNSDTYNTKSECEKAIKSNQYIAINKRNLEKMLNDGWAIAGEEKTVEAKEETKVIDLTGDPEVEEAIRKYYIRKKSQEEAQKKAIDDFLTVKPPEKVEPFNYDKQWERYTKKSEPRAKKAKAEQIESYCN